MMEKSKFTDAQIAFVLARRRRALRLMVRRAVDMAKARGRVPSGLVCSLVRLKWMRGHASAYAELASPSVADEARLAVLVMQQRHLDPSLEGPCRYHDP